MVIDAIDVHGMADLPTFQLAGLERQVHLQGPDPASVALGDALELFFAALSPRHLSNLLQRWGLTTEKEPPEIIGEPFPDQAHWTSAAIGADLVRDNRQRSITITVTVRLDPILFRDLRAEAAREPRLVTALSDGPIITVTVGALFTRSFDAIALSINSAQVGDERFPTLTSERPAWLTRLLSAMGDRFHRFTPDASAVAAWALEAANSRDAYPAYTAWQDALRDRLGEVRAYRDASNAPALLINNRPSRRWGARGAHTAALAAAVYLSGADILWAESDDPIIAEGIKRGALEQVILLSPSGSLRVQPPPQKKKRATAFRTRGPG